MHYQSEYHPMRYHNQLKYLIEYTFDEYIDSPEEQKRKLRGLLLDDIFRNEVCSLFENEYIPYGLSKNQWGQYKEELFGAFNSYLIGGENIFHIQNDLLKMLTKTNVSEVNLTSLRLPFSEFYLYFGDGQLYPTSTHSFIDGAYIGLSHNENESSLFIYLTQYNENFNYKNPNREEVPFLLNDDHLYYLFGVQKEEKIGDLIEKSIRDIEGELNFLGSNWKRHINDVTNLIINALCFLSSKHNDLNKRYPSNTPKSFVKKLKNASTQNTRKITIEKTKKQGFNRINFLGDSVKQKNKKDSTMTETMGNVSPHWRRGHWRNQACGKNRNEHILIWIQPTMVNRALGNPEIKHIYITEQKG